MTETFKRKLAAILSADVKDYTRLMGQDEVLTIRTLTAHREIFSESVQQYKGRIIDTPGDNILAAFESVSNAVNSAVEIQRKLAENNVETPSTRMMRWRIGISIGDVVEEGGRIYGDGVNIAARVEGLAEAGGICISGSVYEQVKSKLGLEYENFGEKEVKNIPEPIRVYRVLIKAPSSEMPQQASTIHQHFTIPGFKGVPAIAVLAFDNLSKDPDQEYFADGIAEDLITRLSSWRSFPVIARNSSFTYKGRAVDVKQVGKELGVRYVVEGSVRKAGDQVRISAQLIDAGTGAHIWAGRYDRKLADIFAIQDEITTAIAAAMFASIDVAERQRLAGPQSQKNITAYDLLIRGKWIASQGFKKFDKARTFFEKAAEIDPQYAIAFSWIAIIYTYASFDPGVNRDMYLSMAEQAARKSISLDPQLPEAQLALAHIHQVRGEKNDSFTAARRAIELNPSYSEAYMHLGIFLAEAGLPDEAIVILEKGIRLSPYDPFLTESYRGISRAYFASQRYDMAIDWAKRSIQQGESFLNWLDLAASQAYMGLLEDAKISLQKAATIAPGELTMTWLRHVFSYIDEDFNKRWFDGLRKAGLPE